MAKYASMIIGHTTVDRNTDYLGNTVEMVGGAVICSAASAFSLGHRVAAVTKVAEKDLDRLEKFTIPKENLFALPSSCSTDMINVYHTADKERRTCTCTSKGDPFCAEELPELDCSVYHLAGLLYGDFSTETIKALAKKGPVAVDVQACLRHRADDGSMFFEDWADKKICLPHIRFLKTDAAEAEIMTGCTDRREAAKYLYSWGAKEILITHNTEVLAYDGRDFFTCPIRARNLSGRTGRGDTTFGAYYTERLSHSVPEALLTATATVSLKMETPGPLNSSREKIQAYIDEFYSDCK